MAKKRIYRQQLNMMNREPQALYLGNIDILSASVSENSTWIDMWFEDNYDRQDHLPRLRKFQLLRNGDIVPPRYTYVTTAVNTYGQAIHIYREDQDLFDEYVAAVEMTAHYAQKLKES